MAVLPAQMTHANHVTSSILPQQLFQQVHMSTNLSPHLTLPAVLQAFTLCKCSKYFIFTRETKFTGRKGVALVEGCVSRRSHHCLCKKSCVGWLGETMPPQLWMLPVRDWHHLGWGKQGNTPWGLFPASIECWVNEDPGWDD